MPMVATESAAVDGNRIAVSRGAAQWAVFAILLSMACGWILYLPVFPSQDGAVHVYYAHVSRDLLLGGHTYGQDYRIARPFPPYAVHAYVLMALLGLTSGVMAEKVLACLCVLVSGIGLAYFATRIGRSAAIAAAMAVPFLLNRYLFLGFYGYLLSLGFALFAMGVWMRADRARPGLRVVFLALVIVTLFSHPVPYLLVVAFCWTQILAGWWNSRGKSEPSSEGIVPIPTAGDLLFVTIATSFFLYILHYSHSGSLWNNELPVNLDVLRIRLLRIVAALHMGDVLPITARPMKWVMTLVLGAAIVATGWRARRDSARKKITQTQMVVGWALLILIGLPLLPRTMNGSGFFAERFAILPPMLFVAAVASVDLGANVRRVVLVAATIVCIYFIVSLNTFIAPFAREVDVSFVRRGELAGEHLLWRVEPWRPTTINFDPLILGDVRLVDRAGAILLDNPWMNLQIMMLDEKGPKVRFDPDDGPRILSGPDMRVGGVASRCAVTHGESTLEHVAAHHPEKWRLKQYGCFEVLLPAD